MAGKDSKSSSSSECSRSIFSKVFFLIKKKKLLAPSVHDFKYCFVICLSEAKKKEVKKETGLGLSYKKDENFGEWYSEVSIEVEASNCVDLN